MSTFATLDDPDFRIWFAGSKAVDDRGHPVMVFRGEHGAQDHRRFQFRHGSISFGDLAAAKIYAASPNDSREQAHTPRILPAYLDIQNPIVNTPDDPFIDVSRLIEILGTDEALRIVHKFSDYVEDTGFWYEDVYGKLKMRTVAEFMAAHPERLSELYFQVFPYLDDASEVEILKAKGFDGAIHCGFGENATECEYKVFDEGQIAPAAPGWMALEEAEEFAKRMREGLGSAAIDDQPVMSGP